jgi:hypothetical protein
VHYTSNQATKIGHSKTINKECQTFLSNYLITQASKIFISQCPDFPEKLITEDSLECELITRLTISFTVGIEEWHVLVWSSGGYYLEGYVQD